jgi:hypothetical protein
MALLLLHQGMAAFACMLLCSVQFSLWCPGLSNELATVLGHIASCRWTMAMQVWELPWRPTVLISGRSYYTVDPASGLITQHKDVWDALDNNQFPSPEAIMLLAQQVRRGVQQLVVGSVRLHARECQRKL